MMIDEFRVRMFGLPSKIRKNLAKFLIKLISKLDDQELVACTIYEEVKIKFKYYVPQDNNWHHYAYTVDMWVNLKEKVKNRKHYVDGVKTKRIKKEKQNGKV